MRKILHSRDAKHIFFLLKIECRGKGQIGKQTHKERMEQTSKCQHRGQLTLKRRREGHVSVEGKTAGVTKCRGIFRWESRKFFCFKDRN